MLNWKLKSVAFALLLTLSGQTVQAAEPSKEPSKAAQAAEAVKEIGGSFFEDYMKVAHEVESKVAAAQIERVKNGQTANKLTEIGYRIKFMGPMMAFMVKRLGLPVVKLIGLIPVA